MPEHFIPRDLTERQVAGFAQDRIAVSAGRLKPYAFVTLALMLALSAHLAKEATQ